MISMVAVKYLASSLSCFKRFSKLINTELSPLRVGNLTNKSENTFSALEGFLYEGLLQYIAVGCGEKDKTTSDTWDLRTGEVINFLYELEDGNSIKAEDLQKMSFETAKIPLLENEFFEDWASECIEWVNDFNDSRVIQNLKTGNWRKEMNVSGKIFSPLGEIKTRGRIDLVCSIEAKSYVFEIKARKTEREADRIQLEIYSQIFDGDVHKKFLILGNSIREIISPSTLDFNGINTDSNINDTNPNYFNCVNCNFHDCQDRYEIN